MPPKKSGGSKLTRSETVTVRLDPKLLYLAEVAARKQRRTLSSYVEWAVSHSFQSVELEEADYGTETVYLSAKAYTLWDSDEAERFVRLCIEYPDLLTFEEQNRWKVIRDSALLLPAKRRGTNGELGWSSIEMEDHVYPTLRKHWDDLLAAIDAGKDQTREWIEATHALYDQNKLFPRYTKPPVNTPSPPSKAPQNFDLDDEIPF